MLVRSMGGTGEPENNLLVAIDSRKGRILDISLIYLNRKCLDFGDGN